jgi:hypothetical protein
MFEPSFIKDKDERPAVAELGEEVLVGVDPGEGGTACPGGSPFLVVLKKNGSSRILKLPNDCRDVTVAHVEGGRLLVALYDGATIVYANGKLQKHRAPKPKGIDAKAAERCSRVPECPLLPAVYFGTPNFRKALASAFQSARLKQPDEWFQDYVSEPMVPILLDGTVYLLGSISGRHTYPSELLVLYAPSTNVLAAAYYDDQGKGVYLGAPSDKHKRVLVNYVDPQSRLRAIIDSPNTRLPIRVD